MKADLQTKKTNEKKAVLPNWEESEFAKTIDGQIMIMVKKAIEDGHFIEAQTLSWSTIEQLLLPRLIGWIAKELGLSLSNEVYKLNAQNVNFLYLCLSHDKELYENLEEGRKNRNKIVHKLTLLGDIKSIKKWAKDYTLSNVLLQKNIMKRFSGEVLIPSINLYKNGWNDALDQAVALINE